jgi:hypothetical protein
VFRQPPPSLADPSATRAVRSGVDEPFVANGCGARARCVRGPLRCDVSGGHLRAGGVSPLSFAYFSLRPAKKSRCRPAQGQRKQTNKNARKGQHRENNRQTKAPQATPSERAQKPSPDHLPKAILSHSLKHRIIFANGIRAMNSDSRVRSTATIQHRR